MSARETKGDAEGWRRGEKGFGSDKTNPGFLKPDYKKELFYKDAVGQRAVNPRGGLQRDY